MNIVLIIEYSFFYPHRNNPLLTLDAFFKIFFVLDFACIKLINGFSGNFWSYFRLLPMRKQVQFMILKNSEHFSN